MNKANNHHEDFCNNEVTENGETEIANQFYMLHYLPYTSNNHTSMTSSLDLILRPASPLEHVAASNNLTPENYMKVRCHVMKLKEVVMNIYKKEMLLIEVALAILMAFYFPDFGMYWLHPKITSHWVAVIIILFISGLTSKMHELSLAASKCKFNSYVFFYNFLVLSLVMNDVAKYLHQSEVISEDLMKGMIICSCLSSPTNMMVVISIAANGDEAASLFISMAMNLAGIFMTPLLLFLYMGEDAGIALLKMSQSITLRLVLPVIVGLSMRYKIQGAESFVTEKMDLLHIVRQRALVFIVYTSFCSTFLSPHDSSSGQVLIMALSQVFLLITAMSVSWVFLFVLFNREPKLRVAGLFASTMKTAVMGIPLIGTICEDHSKLGLYTLPLLIWYPSQLAIGSLLSSKLRSFVDYKMEKYEMERLSQGTAARGNTNLLDDANHPFLSWEQEETS